MNVGDELAALLAPLADAFSSREGADRLLRELGVLTGPAPPPAVPARLAALATVAEQAADAVRALDDPGVPAAGRLAGLVTHLGALFAAIDDLADVAEVDDLDWPFDSPEVWARLARTLPGYLLARWLREEHGAVYEPLRLLGVISPGADGTPAWDLARLADALSGTGPWAGALADPAVLVAPVRRQLDARGITGARPAFPVRVSVDEEDDFAADPVSAEADEVQVVLPGVPGFLASIASIASASGLALHAEGLDRIAGGVALGPGWTLRGNGAAGVAALRAGADWTEPVETATADSAEITVEGRPARPWILLGGGATRLELSAASFGIAADRLRGGTPELAAEFAADGLRLVVSAGDADSFLAAILGGAELGAAMRLAGRWSPADGLSIDGAAGLTIRVDTSVAIGPVTVTGLTLTLTVADGRVQLEITTEVGGRIGPVSAAVAGMGLRLMLTPPEEPGAVRLGPVGVALAFRPPDGVGLGIDAGVAAGGGYLYLDADAGRYDGVIELRLLEVGVSAVVLIDTKAPDVDGWSMFLALFIQVPAIQLGFGFTLTGVGGLAGVNRTVDTAALESAVRSGGLDAVLFPDDPIADAPYVIDQLRSIFPPADGQYVFGPVVRLGWGTPTLVEAQLGIVVTLPDPVIVAVLGSVTSVLPTADLDLVALRLDVAGVVDFAAGTVAIDAALHDSHIAAFALSGDMALRADFTDRPSFLLALGGFHPGFDAPPKFPSIERLRLAIGAPPVLDVSFECYFALTSNTVQFGADFELTADIAGFGIAGGTEFDALVRFSPFEVSTRVGHYVSITAAGIDLAGVWLDATVTGPNPWRFIGDARFKILGLSESIHIDERIGVARQEPAPAAEDPRDEMAAALARPDAWTSGGASDGVILRDAGVEGELVALPDGVLTVSQQVAPLGIRLDKYGNAPIGDYHTFDVEADGGRPAHDWFAPGDYVELTRTERLSAPSFEWLRSGVEFGGGEPAAGPARPISLTFEEILRDPDLAEDRVDLGNTTGRPETWGPGVSAPGFRIEPDPGAVRLRDASYAVAHRTTGARRTAPGSWTGTHQRGGRP
ncbi:DUF6603 domain-containing protein, partial [Acrocarpospora phusangensis]|uniref:DUF6603 domain-containing protein n=1 Tax=Acrocarpospora phusangensis TaxID=1070424 RepID=UPI00194E77AE